MVALSTTFIPLLTLLAHLSAVSASPSSNPALELVERQEPTCTAYTDCSRCPPLEYRCCRRGSETCGCVSVFENNYDLLCL
ncbi:uncharacterized protein BDV14DRAFT_173486 [Aspergillus stella-maris]|uniref:uncharacterized protein n=1 Tax=Aspergillus stella-maris TaxID=1810926 RepID=UPI003CCC9329